MAMRLQCSGCETVVPDGTPLPFRCPRAHEGDDIDHVLRRVLEPDAEQAERLRTTLLENGETHPFFRYRGFSYTYESVRRAGVDDDGFLAAISALDSAVTGVDGRGFVATPFGPARGLAKAIGLDPSCLWIKDETNNVSGSHKARHLFGVMLWLLLAEPILSAARGSDEPSVEAPPLAIASCGNAALAAAVLANAACRPLDVYVPPDAHTEILEQLQRLEARLVPCPRETDRDGDPCYHRFLEAVEAGALPFSCQGNQNGITLDGGRTLGYEIISSLLENGIELDHLFIQIGGGALASSVIQAFEDAVSLGVLTRLPRFHAVQTEGAHPLERAYQRVRDELGGVPAARSAVEGALRRAAVHRSSYMWPWESTPHSLASGILDDETYDWLAIVRGMLLSGGTPIVVDEDAVARAHALAHEFTEIDVCATGSAGVAGLLNWRAQDSSRARERCAVIFTGHER